MIKNRKLFDHLEVYNARLSHERSYFVEKLAPLKSYDLHQNLELKRFHHNLGDEIDCLFNQDAHFVFLNQP